MEENRGWSEILTATVVILTMLALAIFARMKARRRALPPLPPGPWGLPIVGSLLSLSANPHIDFEKLAKQYGPIMMIRVGSLPTVIVSSSQLAKEVFKTHDHILASRPSPPIAVEHFNLGGREMVWAPYGQFWRYVRKFCTHKLLTTNRLLHFQSIRKEEALALVHRALAENAEGTKVPVDLTQFFFDQTLNNITRMVMGKRCYSPDGSRATNDEDGKLGEALKEFIKLLMKPNLSDVIPFLKPLDLQGIDKEARERAKVFEQYTQSIIEEHKKPQQPTAGTPQRLQGDFVDQLLELVDENQSGEAEEVRFSMKDIQALIWDMIAAGSDTSSVSLEWTFAEILRRPELRRRCQEELDREIGPHRLVEEADIPKLRYIQAVVKEAMRFHTPVPVLLPHASTEDCEIAGYHIPAKSRLFINAWAIHRDPAAWERPLEFDPDRFLHSTIDVKGQDFELLPFGSGRRICPGLNLALLMIQYPLAQLLHTCDWELPDGQRPEELDMSAEGGLVHRRVARSPLMAMAKARLPNHIIYDHQTK